jgi:hypothetical protein
MRKKVKEIKPKGDRVSVRGIDPKLWRKARIAAMKEGLAMGEWINKLISNKIGDGNEDGNRKNK